jgi:hypothetical protein
MGTFSRLVAKSEAFLASLSVSSPKLIPAGRTRTQHAAASGAVMAVALGTSVVLSAHGKSPPVGVYTLHVRSTLTSPELPKLSPALDELTNAVLLSVPLLMATALTVTVGADTNSVDIAVGDARATGG